MHQDVSSSESTSVWAFKAWTQATSAQTNFFSIKSRSPPTRWVADRTSQRFPAKLTTSIYGSEVARSRTWKNRPEIGEILVKLFE
jgi:hypothetical protein